MRSMGEERGNRVHAIGKARVPLFYPTACAAGPFLLPAPAGRRRQRFVIRLR